MDIQVLGPGCKNCSNLEKATAEALEQLGMTHDITKITDYGQIAAYGVMKTPALGIDGEIKVSGRVPSVEEITKIISEAVR